jgi:hypothetical protein
MAGEVRTIGVLVASPNDVERTVPAHLAFDHRVDVLRDLRKAGRIALELWVAEPGNRGHARRRYWGAQAHCTEGGREALELIGG